MRATGLSLQSPLDPRSVETTLDEAIAKRLPLLDPSHRSALRLFNGFTEGAPDLAIDLYADTAVIHNYADPPSTGVSLVEAAQRTLLARLPWLQAALLKTRHAASPLERRGTVLLGDSLAASVDENGLHYAVDLTLHQDCSLYLDTRNLRRWVKENVLGKTVLNAFAYTGSLGVAALGGGAARVVQLDRNAGFLEVGRRSYALNGFRARGRDFVRADFFREAGRLRRLKRTFDCVFLDPPFFSSTSAGIIDQEAQSARLINKVRPLVSSGGILVAVNNAVYVSGSEYMRTLEATCADGYLEIERLLPVSADFTGLPDRRQCAPIVDPTPFNHSTKIAILRVKDQKAMDGRSEPLDGNPGKLAGVIEHPSSSSDQ